MGAGLQVAVVTDAARATLEQALALVTGERAEQYGDMVKLHQVVADMWGAYAGVKFTGTDVALMMALVKFARIRKGAHVPDNYTDIAGYAAVAAECAESESI